MQHKTITVTELIERLPSTWNEITLQEYQKTLNIAFDNEQIDDEQTRSLIISGNLLKVAATLIDVPEDLLTALSVADVSRIVKRLSFTRDLPHPLKVSKYKWRTDQKASYDFYVSYMQLSKNPLDNLHLILQSLIVGDVSQEEILSMPMDEAYTGFFLLERFLKQSMRTTKRALVMKIARHTIKTAASNLIRRLLRRTGRSKRN